MQCEIDFGRGVTWILAQNGRVQPEDNHARARLWMRPQDPLSQPMLRERTKPKNPRTMLKP